MTTPALDYNVTTLFHAKLLPAKPGGSGARAWRRRIASDAKLGFAVNQEAALQACQDGEYGLFALVEEQPTRWKGEFIRKL